MQQEILKKANVWLHKPFDEKTQKEVQDLIASNPQGLSDAFFKDLSFGTGGMRGIMGVGTNRINIYTIQFATQGLAHYLKKISTSTPLSVFIGYDVRRHSQEFALEAARVLAANGIYVYLTKDICPTPLVSYGCRHYQCSAAIMLTASHNPPQYNGYKVYWSDGGQVVSPHDAGIVHEVSQIKSPKDVLLAPTNSPFIKRIAQELDVSYLAMAKHLQLHPELSGSSLKIVYTPLHGTGIRIMADALKSWGYKHLFYVEEQKKPDGNFTYAPSPNPEEPKALELGIKKLTAESHDILIATDPDADRMGVVVNHKGHPFILSGNQTACICLFHICSSLRSKKEFPPKASFIKTIVTSELFRNIGESFGGLCIDVLTGFKYIAEQIAIWEKNPDSEQYVFGAEESYGSLFGTMVRDKDAISSACLVAEVAALAKKQNLTLVDRLYQIYKQFGVHRESLTNISFSDSQAGMDQMKSLMDYLRKTPPSFIATIPISSIEDYAKQTKFNLKDKTTTSLALPQSDVIRFWLTDQTKIVIRPSGTEPKIKIYIEVIERDTTDIDASIVKADQRLEKIINSFKKEFMPFIKNNV